LQKIKEKGIHLEFLNFNEIILYSFTATENGTGTIILPYRDGINCNNCIIKVASKNYEAHHIPNFKAKHNSRRNG
jgi:hypothetical protein